MKTINNLLDLFLYTLQNIYTAEKTIQQAMPAVLQKVQHSSLRNALNHHSSLTTEQQKRLEKILQLVNQSEIGRATNFKAFDLNYINKGVLGLLDELKQMLEVDLSKEVTDASIISVVQKLEHYEITSYGTALAYATQLKLHKIEKLLHESLDEEYDIDDLLTSLAMAAINKEAIPANLVTNDKHQSIDETDSSTHLGKVSISERTINSPGGRAGTSHRGYGNGESRGH